MSEHEKLRSAIKHVRNWMTGPGAMDMARLEAVCAAAESTLPRTKMVEVWRLEYAHRGVPKCEVYERRHYADERAGELAANRDGSRERPAFACIRVTGPYMQEVPA